MRSYGKRLNGECTKGAENWARTNGAVLNIVQFKRSRSNRAGSNGARCNEFGSNGVCVMERSLIELVRLSWDLTK